MKKPVNNRAFGPAFPPEMPELDEEGEAFVPVARVFPDDEADGDERPAEAFLDGLLIAVLSPVVSVVAWLFCLALVVCLVGVLYMIVVAVYDWLF